MVFRTYSHPPHMIYGLLSPMTRRKLENKKAGRRRFCAIFVSIISGEDKHVYSDVMYDGIAVLLVGRRTSTMYLRHVQLVVVGCGQTNN